jgi:hypothetical protein
LGLAAVGVGNTCRLRQSEHGPTVVPCVDAGGADAVPRRVIPRFGQLAEYTVEPAALRVVSGGVLHDERGA